MSLTGLIKSLSGIRFRLTFVYSTLFGLFICLFAFVSARQNARAHQNDFDSALLNYTIDLSGHLEEQKLAFTSLLRPSKGESKKEFPFTLKKTYYLVRSLDGRIMTRGGPPDKAFDIPYNSELAAKADYTHRLFSLKVEGEEFRIVNLKTTNQINQAMIVQVASPSAILKDQQQRTLLINLIVIPLLIIVASVASYLISGNALNPIRRLIDTANSIAATNLSLRVPEHDTGDEIFQLSRTFNTLLGRLETSFKAQEHFVANASHQLNTPLAIIKGELDVLESKQRSLEDHERFRRSLREELERLISLVGKMLLVSRVESGQENFIFHPVRIDELLLNTTSRFALSAQSKKITLRFNISESLDERMMMIKGERELLSCLFDNILDNAIKYSPVESVVKISIKESPAGLEVEICDEGPGIEEEELKKILSARFHRASKLLPGTGIGLSIAYQIAHFHQAQIKYRRLKPSGSSFSVQFLTNFATS